MGKTDLRRPLVVCDAGALIHLNELACLDLLADFPAVLVLDEVWREGEWLCRAPEADKPTVLLMIDRNGLEDQMKAVRPTHCLEKLANLLYK